MLELAEWPGFRHGQHLAFDRGQNYPLPNLFVSMLQRMGIDVHFEAVLNDIRARDERDSHRAAAPLRMAEDAVLLDTSEMSIDEAVAAAVAIVEESPFASAND